MKHYRSDVRLRLQALASRLGRDDVLVTVGSDWHYNKIVYQEQVLNRPVSEADHVAHHDATRRYNEVLSDSVFSLCPEGAGPNTLRLWESLAVGAIPVVIADTWRPPRVAGSAVQLPDCCLFVREDEIDRLFDILDGAPRRDAGPGAAPVPAAARPHHLRDGVAAVFPIDGARVKHHPIFEAFERKACTGTGRHVFDFLGSSTDVAFRKGWSQHAPAAGKALTPEYPPLNEHYFDWIATLQAVQAARGTFRMAELGAGWGPWLVRAALAAAQRPAITDTELVAVEADETHHRWLQAHFEANGLRSPRHRTLRGAIAPARGSIRFPKVANPDENYGASTRAVVAGTEYVEVAGYTLEDLLSTFSGPVDLVHVDIQGAEYDVIPPAMPLLGRSVKSMMVGTHLSTAHHDGLRRSFEDHGWRCEMCFPRNELSHTEFGDVTFGDGFLYYRNPVF
jgi:FkbM family methyltransferase